MHIASSFVIPADPERVFDVFLDPVAMRKCIPGCEELERLDDTHYRGKLVNEVAHVRFNAGFAAEIVELERPTRVRAVLTGEDHRLGSSLKLTATLAVEPRGDESDVSYDMEMALWGKLGRLGEPIIRHRSSEVERDFVAALTAVFGPPPTPSTPGEPAAAVAPPEDAETPVSLSPFSPSTVRSRSRKVLVALLVRLRDRIDALLARLE